MNRDEFFTQANLIFKHEDLLARFGCVIQDIKRDRYDALRKPPEQIASEYIPIFKEFEVASPYADQAPAQGLQSAQRDLFKSIGVVSNKKRGLKNLPILLAWLIRFHPAEARCFYEEAGKQLRQNGFSADAALLNSPIEPESAFLEPKSSDGSVPNKAGQTADFILQDDASNGERDKTRPESEAKSSRKSALRTWIFLGEVTSFPNNLIGYVVAISFVVSLVAGVLTIRERGEHGLNEPAQESGNPTISSMPDNSDTPARSPSPGEQIGDEVVSPARAASSSPEDEQIDISDLELPEPSQNAMRTEPPQEVDGDLVAEAPIVMASFDWAGRQLDPILVSEAALGPNSSAQSGYNIAEIPGLETISNVRIPAEAQVSFSSAESSLSSISFHGRPVQIIPRGNGYVGLASGQQVFSFRLTRSGEVAFELDRSLDHPNSDELQLNFGIEATDSTGNSIGVASIAILVVDDRPNAYDTFCAFYEGNIAAGQGSLSGQLTQRNGETVDFGADGPGLVAFSGGYQIASANPYRYDGTASEAFEALSVVPLIGAHPLEIDVRDYSVYGTANRELVFLLSLTPQTGRYTYQQLVPMDHARTTGTENAYYMSFDVAVTDRDGDEVAARIEIDVYDESTGRVAHVMNAIRQ